MKIAVYLLACLFVYVASENCMTSINECQNTACKTNFTVHCIDGLCTCLSRPTDQSCSVASDCSSATADHGHHHHCHTDGNTVTFHCIDFRCRCLH
ncbi:serine protease inhibitor Cvsi-2-like [Mercenaria mercenaria]|uniref:serine protease inhibitor Cvsi-2-like n=1 Tax=Mercenaria mercenaria TaxID=6596 RepID=UPI00234F209B|nr:serine protease inhibitor Cvsi-2-like [Mercenaria mercenaria]